MVKGTQGYASVTREFVKATHNLSFTELHKDFIPYIPKKRSNILDLGAGIGRDAHELSEMGHSVIALEPLEEFRISGMNLYPSSNITWIDDSLPKLERLKKSSSKFDFILSSGVWHHLTPKEQELALSEVSILLNKNGVLALSLRNGPAGAGSHIFPTDGKKTIQMAGTLGLKCVLHLENQPSLLKHKKKVSWSRLALKK
ncbi:MAG: class I SAM-dependent methyltransferase [Balneola sp.]|nr:MAG: class I SAM-dependent methyltransferase [Balneola sp.]